MQFGARGNVVHISTCPNRAIPRSLAARAVRFGAYGDPTLIPLGILRYIAFFSKKWTGYTHQWRRAKYQPYREYIMASVDNLAELESARELGWRTFRVRANGAPLMQGEISCPASDEMEKRTTCERCGLCNGARRDNDARATIAIVVHGAGKKNLIQLS